MKELALKPGDVITHKDFGTWIVISKSAFIDGAPSLKLIFTPDCSRVVWVVWPKKTEAYVLNKSNNHYRVYRGTEQLK